MEVPDLTIGLRQATIDDVRTLETLVAESARGLGQSDYSSSQIEAAIRTAWAVDRQLIHDGTFWIAEVSGETAGCGGWSWRQALTSANEADAEADVVRPAVHAARIRAFFVHPRWVRHGVATALLKKCEEDARAAGFRSVELLATLPGERFYASRGYASGTRYDFTLEEGQSNTVVPMWKSLV